MASTRIISSFQPNCFCPQQIPALFHTTWHFTPGREKVRSSSSLRSPIAVNNTSLSYPPLRPALPHTLPKSKPSGPHPAHRNYPTYYSITPTSVQPPVLHSFHSDSAMENYSFNSYPDSGESSPRSREIDFENPPPWDDQQQPPNYKAKFMCSYGGKIHPRPHDNQLSYLGGETKILAVDRYIKFDAIISKLSSLCADAEVAFKYQLPGEDLDALISVTNDDDLDHMMHEYDRLYRASAKPARMRLFVFQAPAPNQSSSSFGSEGGRSDRERFVDALNSGPTEPPKAPAQNDVDILVGLDKGVPPPQPAANLRDSVPEPVAPPHTEFQSRAVHGDRVYGSDTANPVEMQRQLQELQRLHIGDQEQSVMYTRKSDENLVGAYPGDYYFPKAPEKAPPANLPPASGFWTEKQFSGGGFPGSAQGAPDQPMYVFSGPGGTVYHAPPMVRPMNAPASQGYYAMQRVPPDVYRDQPVYNVVPQQQSQQPPMSAAPQQVLQQQLPKMTAYTEGYGMMRPSGGGAVVTDTGGYAPAGATGGFDGGVGRPVYYTTATAPYHGVGVAVSSDMRQAGALGQEGKVVNKVSQPSV